MPQAEPRRMPSGRWTSSAAAVFAVEAVEHGEQAGDAERPDRVGEFAQPDADQQVAEDDRDGDGRLAGHQVGDEGSGDGAGEGARDAQAAAVHDVAPAAGGAAHDERGDHRPGPAVREEQVPGGEGGRHGGGELPGQPGLRLQVTPSAGAGAGSGGVGVGAFARRQHADGGGAGADGGQGGVERGGEPGGGAGAGRGVGRGGRRYGGRHPAGGRVRRRDRLDAGGGPVAGGRGPVLCADLGGEDSGRQGVERGVVGTLRQPGGGEAGLHGERGPVQRPGGAGVCASAGGEGAQSAGRPHEVVGGGRRFAGRPDGHDALGGDHAGHGDESGDGTPQRAGGPGGARRDRRDQDSDQRGEREAAEAPCLPAEAHQVAGATDRGDEGGRAEPRVLQHETPHTAGEDADQGDVAEGGQPVREGGRVQAAGDHDGDDGRDHHQAAGQISGSADRARHQQGADGGDDRMYGDPKSHPSRVHQAQSDQHSCPPLGFRRGHSRG